MRGGSWRGGVIVKQGKENVQFSSLVAHISETVSRIFNVFEINFQDNLKKNICESNNK